MRLGNAAAKTPPRGRSQAEHDELLAPFFHREWRRSMPIMPSRRMLLAAAAALAGGAGSKTAPAEAQDAADPTIGRKLIFDEQFASLDPAIWHAGPKSTTNDAGFYGRSAFSRRGGRRASTPMPSLPIRKPPADMRSR
jgi:hypothetical protein